MRFTRSAFLRSAAVALIGVAAAPTAAAADLEPFTVYVAGDSTASTYALAEAPRAGWGQALPVFLKQRRARVVNEALSGASSKSFVDLGRLDRILAAIKPGDHLLVSFGHNDSKPDEARHTDPFTTYQQYLRRYLDGARARGAHPVLVTSVERRRFDETGHAKPSLGDYPEAMRQLGAATATPVIDLTAQSMALWDAEGPEGTKNHFLWLKPGEHASYPNGVEDNTHFKAHGAIEVARLVARSLHSQRLLPARTLHRLSDEIPGSELIWPLERPI